MTFRIENIQCRKEGLAEKTGREIEFQADVRARHGQQVEWARPTVLGGGTQPQGGLDTAADPPVPPVEPVLAAGQPPAGGTIGSPV